MPRQLTPQEQEQIRQVAATMAIENMPVTKTMLQDAIDYLTGAKSEQEIFGDIARVAKQMELAYA